MHPSLRVLVAALIVVLVAVGVVIPRTIGRADRVGHSRPVLHGSGPQLHLEGIFEPVAVARWTWGAVVVWNTELARAAAARAAEQERARTQRPSPPSSGGSITGPCAAMKPPGFPDSIIERESGGDPNAVNSSSGASGCAQVMPFHWANTCAGLDYQACWARLWADGAGASHWATG